MTPLIACQRLLPNRSASKRPNNAIRSAALERVSGTVPELLNAFAGLPRLTDDPVNLSLDDQLLDVRCLAEQGTTH